MKKMILVFMVAMSLNSNSKVFCQDFVQKLGEYHNNGIDFIKNKVTTYSIQSIVNNINQYNVFYNDVNFQSVENSVVSELDGFINSEKNIQGLIARNKIEYSKSNNIISDYQYTKLLEFMEIMNNATNTDNNLKNILLSKMNGDFEISGAFQIVLSSIDYWNSNLPPDNGTQAITLAYADGVGFVIGWLGTVWEDYNDDGNVLAKDQYNRLGKAGIYALGASDGKYKKLW